ncbi:hypothetical protein [uncultured Megasphaera sp.]|jgi:hypothetical protein|uniref:hypothetical protein n=1 Tax=uncultured Megasphaera sp. TaxID=165188 RepID=UPI002596AB74|nr:hypothetical protein [uncultured Megasphaera sp.]
MPYLANLRYEETAYRQYLQDLFNSVELKDIVQRNKVRDVGMLEQIIAYVTANIGITFSSTAISEYLKSKGQSVLPETVLGYLKACTDVFLFYQVNRKDLRGKKNTMWLIMACGRLYLAVTNETSQVAYLVVSEVTIQREFGVYECVRDNYPKYVSYTGHV